MEQKVRRIWTYNLDNDYCIANSLWTLEEMSHNQKQDNKIVVDSESILRNAQPGDTITLTATSWTGAYAFYHSVIKKIEFSNDKLIIHIKDLHLF